jgi:hypothetical protein
MPNRMLAGMLSDLMSPCKRIVQGGHMSQTSAILSPSGTGQQYMSHSHVPGGMPLLRFLEAGGWHR